MARPISWLPRLAEIRRAVMNSKREFYDRQALERLFQVQRRAVSNLMAVLPAVKVGSSLVVEREVLARFLEELSSSEDASTVFTRQRGKKPRRTSRLMVKRELISEGRLDTLPAGVTIERGHLKVEFGSKMELMESLATFLGAVENDEDTFIERYVVTAPGREARERIRKELHDVRLLFQELRQKEADRDKKIS